MKYKSIIIIVVAILAILLVIFFRSSKNSDQNTVKVGNILYMTGPLAALGEQELNGMKLAEKHINDAGGIHGKKLEILTQDYASDPKLAVPAYEFLKQQDVNFFLVDGGSAVSPIVPLLRKNGDFGMVPVAITPTYFDDNARTCRVALTARDFVGEIGNFLNKKFIKPRISFLVSANEYGKAVQTSLTESVVNAGGRVVSVEMYDQASSDFRTQITKIKAKQSEIDALIIINATKSVETMIQQIKQLGFSKLIVSDTFTILNASLKNLSTAEGIAFVDYPFTSEPQSVDPAGLSRFKHEYYSVYNSYPSAASINGYDSLMVLTKAMNESSVLAPDVVSVQMTSPGFKYTGVGGDLSFDSSCEVQRQATMRTVKDGKVVEVMK